MQKITEPYTFKFIKTEKEFTADAVIGSDFVRSSCNLSVADCENHAIDSLARRLVSLYNRKNNIETNHNLTQFNEVSNFIKTQNNGTNNK